MAWVLARTLIDLASRQRRPTGGRTCGRKVRALQMFVGVLRRWSVGPLDCDGGCLPAADAQRGHAPPHPVGLQGREERDHHPGA